MTIRKDWLAYVLEPRDILPDLEKLSDDLKVKLMRSFLSQAECHERRLSSVSAGEEDKASLEMSSSSPASDPVRINYDKSKTLDCLALVIAASLNFNVNLFAGVTTELPLRLASRLYRTLFHTLLERHSRGFAANGGPCATPYDLGPWTSLQPALAFANLVYHLWCLQVALSDSMLAQPNRDLTPAVWGLSEVPDQAFFQDSRADREALLMRHEESALRVHDLLRRLQVDGPTLSVARPTPVSLAKAIISCETDMEDEVTLSSDRLVAGSAFTLGRLAFQHNLLEKAVGLFLLAQNAINTSGLEYIEEAGMTSLLVESYLSCCQKQQLSVLLSASPPTTPCWRLVDTFCTALRQSLDSKDPDFNFLGFSFGSPLRVNLRGSSSSSREVKKTEEKSKFSQHEIITALEVDASTLVFIVPQLGFGLRRHLQNLISDTLIALAARCTKSSRKEAMQLKRIFNDWQSFYTKIVVNNGIKEILQCSSAQSAAFCEMLLLATEDNPPAVDAKEAADLLFTELDQCHHRDKARTAEVINFVSDFLIRIRLMLSSEKSTVSFRTAMFFVNALAGSSLISALPTNLRAVVEVLQKGRFSEIQTPDSLLHDLPEMGIGDASPPPLVMSHRHRGHICAESHITSPFSLLTTSSNPNVVVNACTDLLNGGSAVEVILRCGGWIDTTIPTVLKWISPSDHPSKKRREVSLNGGISLPPLYEFVAMASENSQCCLPALVLLLRAIDCRRDQNDWELAVAFCQAVNHILPPPVQNTQGTPAVSAGGPPWRRSFTRWIRGVMEHESLILDLLRSMNYVTPVSNSSQSHSEEAELMSRCKAILTNDLGPDAIISDDLVSIAACYLVNKESTFVSSLSGGPPILELFTLLHKLSLEKEKPPQTLRELYANRLIICLRPLVDMPPSLPPSFRSSRDPRHLTTFTAGGSNAGTPALSNISTSPADTETLRFLIRLLTQLRTEVHRRLLDYFISFLATCLMTVHPLFKTEAISEPWQSFSPLPISTSPKALLELLQFALKYGISSAPQNVKWLLLQADLQMASVNADPRSVLSLILQAAAADSNYFSRPVPSSVFNERRLTTMVQCCRSLGHIGDAIALCQFGPERSSLLATGLDIINSVHCEKDLGLPYNFEALDDMAVFLWNLDLLTALTNLQNFHFSQSRRTTFLRCINQPEVNMSNSREILQLTKNKRAAEFLRHLSRHFST